MNLQIKNYSLDTFDKKILKDLKKVFDTAYFDSHMYVNFLEDLKEKHKYLQVFLAYDDEKIIWVVVLEDKIHKWIDYENFPPVHLKRFAVDEKYRWKWIWKKLLDVAQNYAFNHYWLSVIFWESNEIWWIRFYLWQWALFNQEIIETYLRRNSKRENLFLFKEFITNKNLGVFRYPEGNGLLFVFVKNAEIKNDFEKRWFYDIMHFSNL